MFAKSGPKIEFQQSVYGTWGQFATPAGTVAFLETKARIGATAKDRERRLARALRPVREVLPTQTMDFNQLLQRDLDDHRVATELVNYVLTAGRTGPAFFPPIVAAVLPFNGNDPRKTFPDATTVEPTDAVGHWRGMQFGSAFQFERLLDDQGGDFEIKVGRLSWNPEETKLVVIDGQHRAMALLAIDRTINNSWSESGEKYKYFYEPVIQEILKGKSEADRQALLQSLEFPVTLVWFPDENKEGGDHHGAARKLFVDVNQNARKPSESRILLLSDADLIGIFTRSVLNTFRGSADTLPIYAVEYDHPGRDQASSSKWSVISNVITLRDCINRSVFGPPRYIDKLDVSFGGRESEFERAQFMRETLQVDEGIGETIEDMDRADISSTNFPRSKLSFLKDQLMRGWGAFIVRMLSNLLPYKIHGEALTKLRHGWATAGSTDSLAKDAIFEGVGMYWTIRDSYEHWERMNKLRADLKQPKVEKTDIVRTWEVLQQKKQDFVDLRASLYVGKHDPAKPKSLDAEIAKTVNGAFDIFGTNACQLGFVLAARTLAKRGKVLLDVMPDFTDAIIQAANAALEGGPKGEFGRRTMFWGGHQDALNRIPKLDTPFAVQFRYFWLELLATPEGLAHLGTVLDSALVRVARDEGRAAYLSYLTREIERALRKAEPGIGKAELEKRARDTAEETLRKALSRWFGIKKQEFEDWLSAKPDVQLANPINEQDMEAGEAADAGELGSPSLEDLLEAEPEDE